MYKDFKIGFWHPFGPHGRETTQEILNRKRKESDNNGWTLWSFQRRTQATLDCWQRELASVEQVFVFCSDGQGAVDPARDGNGSQPLDCKYYRFAEGSAAPWHPMPPGVRVPHPFRPGQTEALAFVVQQITYPVESFDLPALEWFSRTQGGWRQRPLPTRPEYLIRPGGTFPMRKVSAVLQLKPPYLSVVTIETPNSRTYDQWTA